jgi:hypothetical protein
MTARSSTSVMPEGTQMMTRGLKNWKPADLMDKLPEHPLGHVVIGDHALAQRTDGHDVAGRTAQHGLRVCADLQQFAVFLSSATTDGSLRQFPCPSHIPERKRYPSRYRYPLSWTYFHLIVFYISQAAAPQDGRTAYIIVTELFFCKIILAPPHFFMYFHGFFT